MSEAQEKGIRYFPIALFASVMGVSGLAMSMRLVENIYGWNNVTSNTIVVIATLMFLANIIIFFYRLVKFPEDVKQDFNHPVKMNFFGAISISLLLLGTLYFDMHAGLSFYTWLIGALVQFFLTLAILSKLIWKHEFQLGHFNPAWFIPIVGNIVVPLAGVHHAAMWINWMFFGIGIVFSVIYYTIFIHRIYFSPPFPVKLMPTYFILLAPPGIGFIAYIKMTGEYDMFAYVLIGFALYLGFLFLFQLHRFFTIPFFVSWWAFIFPSAAVTNAVIHFQQHIGGTVLEIICHLQVGGLITLTVYVFYKTVELFLKRKLCVKEG